MGRSTKIWLSFAAILVAAGIVLFAVALWEVNFDINKLSTDTYVTNIYEISQDFSRLSLDTDTAAISFALSADGKCKVECYEEEKAKHTASVEGDTLVIKVMNRKQWYDYIGIHFDSPKITVYLPKSEYAALSIRENTGIVQLPTELTFESVDITTDTGSVYCLSTVSGQLKIKTDTGKISVENTFVGAAELSVSTGLVTVSQVNCRENICIQVSTGRANLTGIACKNLTSNGDTGDIALKQVIAQEKITIERDTGDVMLDASDAAEISVKTDTGDVTGSLLSAKVFVITTDTGTVQVPKSTVGGRCEISTDTGDIRITVP